MEAIEGIVVLVETAPCPQCEGTMPMLMVERVVHNPSNCAVYRERHGGEPCECMITEHLMFLWYLMEYEGCDIPGGTFITRAPVFIEGNKNN